MFDLGIYMANDIQNFLENYFLESGLSRGHENVRYLQYLLTDGHSPASFDDLYSGKKNAAFRVREWYISQGIRVPEVDHVVVFTGFFGEPHAVVKITRVETVVYKDITPEMALASGVEGGDVAVWKNTRHEAILADCDTINVTFDERIELMAMWFDLLHPN